LYFVQTVFNRIYYRDKKVVGVFVKFSCASSAESYPELALVVTQQRFGYWPGAGNRVEATTMHPAHAEFTEY
jgi:hypothetical protein